MYKNIFKSSVELYNIAHAFEIYGDITVPLPIAIRDWYGFVEDMEKRLNEGL